MDDLYFKGISELEQFLSGLNKINSGVEGTCYGLDKDYVLKIFHNFLETSSNSYNSAYYLKFKNIRLDRFYFTTNVVYMEINNSICVIGTISRYANGKQLDLDTLYHVPINDIIVGIDNLIPAIRELSKKHIKIGSIFVGNILYDSKECSFNFIDTDNYYYSDESLSTIYRYNFREIIRELLEGITGSYKNMDIINYLISTNNQFNYIYNQMLLNNPIALIKGLKENLEYFCNIKINCFSDCEHILTKKLKYN